MMRYILVNRTNKPVEVSDCAICCTALGKSYMRDLQTLICYHSHFCLELHIYQSQQAIGAYDGQTRLLPKP